MEPEQLSFCGSHFDDINVEIANSHPMARAHSAATTTASSSGVRTVERASFGPVLRSVTISRCLHFDVVFGSTL
jgi:hypothetical protein